MTTKPHVEQALQAELQAPRVSDGRAEQAAFAACTTLAVIGASTAVPVAGPVAAAVLIAAYGPSFRQQVAEKTLEQKIAQQVQEALDLELSARVLPGQPEDERVKVWQRWLPWHELRAGQHIDVPADLPHPSCAGFEYTRLASRCGQAADWACPLADGSRLHAHEYRDGHVTLHQDKLDPAQGPATAVIHWMAEAREGQMLAVALTIGLIATGAALVNRGLL